MIGCVSSLLALACMQEYGLYCFNFFLIFALHIVMQLGVSMKLKFCLLECNWFCWDPWNLSLLHNIT